MARRLIFFGAGHLFHRYKESTTEVHQTFHLNRHLIFIRLLKNLVAKYGDFTKAKDSSNRDLDRRETWGSEWILLPDNRMFNSFRPDWRAPLGEEYAADIYLKDDHWKSFLSQMKNMSIVN